MSIAVKFCGGCNPYYDAAKARQKAEKIVGAKFFAYDAEAPPDICILFKQCNSACFPEPQKFAKRLAVVVTREQEVEAAAQQIRAALDDYERDTNDPSNKISIE